MAAERTMREEDGDIIYGAGQKLPLWGKPKAERRMARAELSAEMANAEYQWQLLRRDLAKAAFGAALANASIDYGEQDLVWLNTIAETVQARFQSGQASLAETLQVQNERARRATQPRTTGRSFPKRMWC
jgi:outer membrane protein TolC